MSPQELPPVSDQPQIIALSYQFLEIQIIGGGGDTKRQVRRHDIYWGFIVIQTIGKEFHFLPLCLARGVTMPVIPSPRSLKETGGSYDVTQCCPISHSKLVHSPCPDTLHNSFLESRTVTPSDDSWVGYHQKVLTGHPGWHLHSHVCISARQVGSASPSSSCLGTCNFS